MIKQKIFSLTLLFSISVGFTAHADEISQMKRQANAGGLGGPDSVGAQLEEDNIAKEQSSRWSGLDKSFDGFVSAKDDFKKRTNLQLGLRYSASYQSASSTLTNEDDGAAGQIRLMGKWRLYEQDENNFGNFVFLIENRHSIGGGVTPAALSSEIGSFGPTGLSYGDNGSALTVAFWEQSLADRRMGIWAGRIDPTDLTDILGYANQRTTFTNASIIANLVVVAPGPGFGLGLGGMITDNIYSVGTITDANGSYSDIEWFPGGSEFYKYVELGWVPSREDRYTRNIHIGAFQMDARSDAGADEAHGFVFSTNWLIGENWLPFLRAGFSDGDGAVVDKSFSIGTVYRPGKYSDLIGIGMNWLDPTNPGSQDQTSTELFYRFTVSKYLAITASVQAIFNPSDNLTEDEITVFGLRARLAM